MAASLTEWMTPALLDFREAAAAVGAEVRTQSDAVISAFQKEDEFLRQVAQQTKPSDDESFQNMLAPVAAEIAKVNDLAASVPPSRPYFNHLSAVGESIGVLGWVAVDSNPVAFIGDTEATGEFYLAKVLMAHKKSDDIAVHEGFVKSLREVYARLKAFVKEHHTSALVWNTANAPQRNVHAPAAQHGHEDNGGVDEPNGGNDAPAEFQAIIDGPLANYVRASRAIGGAVEQQASIVAAAFAEEQAFLRTASTRTAPASEDELQGMLAPIASHMGGVGEVAASYPPRDQLINHVMALGESVSVLGWVAVDSKPVTYIGDMEEAGEFYLSKVLMQAKKNADFATHEVWVNSVRELYGSLKAFVKKHHPTKLQWNVANMPRSKGRPRSSVASKATTRASSGDGPHDALSAFQAILDGPLLVYVQTSRTLGGVVQQQASSVAQAFAEESKFLNVAARQPAPQSPDELQKMVEPVGVPMGAVADAATSLPPRDRFVNHVTAVGESVSALGWVAVDSRPATYVGDMMEAGEFYLSKVLVQTKREPDAAAHESWVKSVRELFGALKAYVQEHHTTKLRWNFGAGAQRRNAQVAPEAAEDAGLGGDPLSAFERLILGPLSEYVDLSNRIGGVVAKQAGDFAAAFKSELDLIRQASTTHKVGDAALQEMVRPVGDNLAKVMSAVDATSPDDALRNHVQAVSESSNALGLVMADASVPFVTESIEAGNFYSMRVLAAYRKKEGGEVHESWVKALQATLEALKVYTKEHCPLGLRWNWRK